MQEEKMNGDDKSKLESDEDINEKEYNKILEEFNKEDEEDEEKLFEYAD
jgi:hypothetical protein